MNQIVTYFMTGVLLVQNHVEARSNRTSEEGNQTTDNLWWAVFVIAIAGAATLAVGAFANGLIGQIG